MVCDNSDLEPDGWCTNCGKAIMFPEQGTYRCPCGEGAEVTTGDTAAYQKVEFNSAKLPEMGIVV